MEQSLVEQCRSMLKKNQLDPIKKLGKGGFGLVYLVSKTNFSNYSTELYSVKCTSKKQFSRKPMLRRYLKQEISILQSLDHENIVQLIRTFEDNGWIFMVMQYCDLGNLSMLQAEKKEGVFTFEQTSEIIGDVINGLDYMHSKDIIHRDIKPENVLRKRENSQFLTKICDLGFSRQAKEEVDTFCGTTYYMAPELFQKKKYDRSVDIWALGILIYRMLFGNEPFKSMNMEAEIISKCENGFQLGKSLTKYNFNSTVDEEKKKMLAELFERIFNLDPRKRPNLKQIRNYLQKSQNPSKDYRLKEGLKKKNTLETDNSEGESTSSYIPFEVQKVYFIQTINEEVDKLKLLSSFENLAFKYYLDKVCFQILQSIQTLTQDQKLTSLALKGSIQKNHKLLKNSLKDCPISDLKKVFSLTIQNSFNQYKEEYRIVVGHVFHKVHKFVEDAELKARMKLKVFCCHAINRVFEKENRKSVFPHYYEWEQKNGRKQCFDIKYLKEWMEKQSVKKVSETVDLINNRFYRKGK